MPAWIPEIGDIVTAVISLACRGGEQLHIPRVYAALNDLKGRNDLLSGLYFSITGAVCYSPQIDDALRALVAKGLLVRKGSDTLVVRDSDVEDVRGRLRRKLPSAAYRSLKNASGWFYGQVLSRRDVTPDPRPGPE